LRSRSSQTYTWPGSNWRPSACEADVIATRPQVPWFCREGSYDLLSIHRGRTLEYPRAALRLPFDSRRSASFCLVALSRLRSPPLVSFRSSSRLVSRLALVSLSLYLSIYLSLSLRLPSLFRCRAVAVRFGGGEKGQYGGGWRAGQLGRLRPSLSSAGRIAASVWAPTGPPTHCFGPADSCCSPSSSPLLFFFSPLPCSRLFSSTLSPALLSPPSLPFSAPRSSPLLSPPPLFASRRSSPLPFASERESEEEREREREIVGERAMGRREERGARGR
jgi:hypothetical protein